LTISFQGSSGKERQPSIEQEIQKAVEVVTETEVAMVTILILKNRNMLKVHT
jgi:hypothetical protein